MRGGGGSGILYSIKIHMILLKVIDDALCDRSIDEM